MTQHSTSAGLAGTVDHVDAGDGWLVVRLMTRQAMDREGAHMGHCLRGHSYGYGRLAGEEEMTGDSIWSLRDPAGMSRATLDIRSCRVIMANGKGNSAVGGKAARRLKALVAAFKAAGHELDFNGETGIVVAPNGYVCREDQAPAEVLEAVKARHKAARDAVREALRQARQGMFSTPTIRWRAIPWTEEPLLSDRVAIGVDTQAASPEARGVARWSATELLDMLTIDDEPSVEISGSIERVPVDIATDESPQRPILATHSFRMGGIYMRPVGSDEPFQEVSRDVWRRRRA